MKANIERHSECHMRSKFGNCNPVGGFCTAVSGEICEAVHKAFNMGYSECIDMHWKFPDTIYPPTKRKPT